MAEPKWTVGDVINLIEKGTGLIVQLVRTFEDPGIVLKKITDRTQELHDAERALDRKLEAKYASRDEED